jgi:hypothetical protein
MKKSKLLTSLLLVGLIILSIKTNAQCVGANMSNPIDIGTIGAGTNYSNTQNNSNTCFLNDIGQASMDIYYRFTITSTYVVNLSHCGSGFDTYMHLLNSSGGAITTSDDNGPICSGATASITQSLSAGTYYVVSEGYGSNSGNIITQISIAGSAGGSSYWQLNGTNIYNTNSGSVGIGTTSPQKFLHLSGVNDVEQLIEATNDGYASLTLKSNGKQWHWSKRPSSAGDALQLYYHDGTNWLNPFMSILPNSSIGIGTTTPQSKLDVVGIGNYNVDFRVNGRIQTGDNTNNGGVWLNSANTQFVGQYSGNVLGVYNNGNWRMVVDQNGQIGIGTTNISDASYKLFVETGIRTRKVKVDQTAWPDFVFARNYKLPSLKELEQFILKNQHLPEVPSAKEVEKNGIDLGDNQALLLKKIEELTLYVIEQNKQIDILKQEVQLMKNKSHK